MFINLNNVLRTKKDLLKETLSALVAAPIACFLAAA